MSAAEFDLAIIGAGSGGLTAADFAAELGAKVALVEKNRIGGDCTWTGCVPSKALLKAAKIAHDVRTASRFGIAASPPAIEMTNVRAFIRRAIAAVYKAETPEALSQRGIEVIQGAARFTDPSTIAAGDQVIRAKSFLVATGARPQIPPIAGLDDVPFLTYEQIFENDRLPQALIVIGGGPVGMEIAQAYRRLGAEVTIVTDRILPKDEPEAREVIQRVFEREVIRFVWGRATSARKQGDEIVIATDHEEARGDLLLIAVGRRPRISELDLEKAGVHYSGKAIPVDDHLRTNVKHIYAAGDVLGGYQFTHLAGWQAFQAARNALLPGSSSGRADVVPWVTFTDPEVAHVGLAQEQARAQFGDRIRVGRWEVSRIDRAICEDDGDGFIQVITKTDGAVLGATVVNARAGDMITEFTTAIHRNMNISDLAGIIHPYPTYSSATQQLAAEMTIEKTLAGASGKIIRGVSKIIR